MANYKTRPEQPAESKWAELREAQTSALTLPMTGEAILIDAGEEADIHPRDKASPGERLARLALANTYGQEQIACCGPVLKSWQVEGDKVRPSFQHGDGGLVATPLPESYRPSSQRPERKSVIRHGLDGALKGFAVCGADHVWRWS